MKPDLDWAEPLPPPPPREKPKRRKKKSAIAASWDKNSTRRAIRASFAEWDRWHRCVERSGLTWNGWLRRAANRQSDLEEALLGMEATERDKGLLVDRSVPEGH